MNAAARALHQANVFRGQWHILAFPREFLLILLLSIGVLLSSFAIVYMKNTQRNLISELQQLQQHKQQLQVQWDQLLLEKGAWISPARLQSIASHQLKMTVASLHHFVVLSLE